MTFPPCPEPFNMAAYVLRAAQTTPDKTALEILSPDTVETWSYAALDRAVMGVATGFLAHGLRAGDRILLRMGHSVDVPLCYLAALAVDMVPIPVSSQLTEAELTPMAAMVAPRLIVADPDLALPEGRYDTVTTDLIADWRDLEPASPVLGQADRPGYIVFTSGTTAGPRAVLHAHRAIWARRAMIRDWSDLRPDDRILHAGAFNWTYTMGVGLMDPWSVGATALIAAPPRRPDALAPLLADSGATLFAAAPGVYRQMLRYDMPDLPCLRHGLSAGEKLPEATRSDWRARTGTDLHEAFGQSECSTFLSGAPHRPAPPGTLGRAQSGRRVAVLEDGVVLPPDTPGDLAIATDDPGLMLGYLDGPEAAPAREGGAWFSTGDRASIDAAGWITYLGRGDDLLNAGGYRVSPLEIEAVAEAFPGLREAAAVSRPVREGVEVIALCYVAEAPLDEDALAAHCAARLARYKCPRILEAHAALPRSANGKLLRRALRTVPKEAP